MTTLEYLMHLLHAFGKWEESRAPGGSPHEHFLTFPGVCLVPAFVRIASFLWWCGVCVGGSTDLQTK